MQSEASGSQQTQIKFVFILVNVGVCSCCRLFLAETQFLFSLQFVRIDLFQIFTIQFQTETVCM